MDDLNKIRKKIDNVKIQLTIEERNMKRIKNNLKMDLDSSNNNLNLLIKKIKKLKKEKKLLLKKIEDLIRPIEDGY